MASNIRVVLEVDNKKYLADMREADRATKDFAATAGAMGGASQGFIKLGGAMDVVHRKMMSLKTLVAGAFFAGLGRSALQMADELQDLSNATGITTARLIELKKALATSGGDADQMSTAINAFVRSIDEAAQGSISAQRAFRDMGISFKELNTLSEQALFEEALKGIAAIEDPARRSTLMMQNFGKSFKTVDPEELLNKLRATRGEGDKYAASIQRAAELQDAFATAQGNIKLAFLEAFAPAIKLINDFAVKVNEGKASMDNLVTGIKAVGVALAAVFGVSIGLGISTFIGQVGRAVSVITGFGAAVTKAGQVAAMGGMFAANGALMVGIRGITALLGGLGAALFVASNLFTDFGNTASGAIARIIEVVGQLTAMLSGGALGAAAGSAFGPIGTFLGGIAGSAAGLAGMNLLVDKAKEARKAVEEIGGGRGKVNPPLVQPDQTGNRGGVDALAAAYNKLAMEIEAVGKQYANNHKHRMMDLQLETILVGKTEDQVELFRALDQQAHQLEDTIKSLNEKRAEWAVGNEEQRKSLHLIDAEKAKLIELSEARRDELILTITNLQSTRLLEKARLADIENMTKAMEAQLRVQEALSSARLSIIGQQQDVAFAGAQAGRSPFERQMAEIKEGARKAALEAGRAFAQAFEDTGDGMTPEQAQAFADGLKAIEDGYKAIAAAQLENLEASRTWEAGWTEAFNAYKDSAQNAAEQSKTYFETFTRGVEDAFVRFVQTGKLSFKDLANSLIADFARIQAKKALTGLFNMGGGGGGGFGSLFGGIGKLFGFANGGNPPVGVPSIVGERGPELFVPRNAGTIIPNHMLGSGSNQTMVTYNIQAVDAASFQQLVARDPKFLHAVVEKGRRSMPQGAQR